MKKPKKTIKERLKEYDKFIKENDKNKENIVIHTTLSDYLRIKEIYNSK